MKKDVLERWEAHVEKGSSCWIWHKRGRWKPTGKGGRSWADEPLEESEYPRMRVNGRREQASRVAWELYRGPIPPGVNVLHRCDRPHCVRPDHLFLGSQRENILDSIAKGRFWRPNGGRQKLTEAVVREIRRLYRRGGWSHRRLALRFGVTQPAITMVLNGKTWKHVPDSERSETEAPLTPQP